MDWPSLAASRLLKGLTGSILIRNGEIWDLMVSSLETCWKTFSRCLLTFRVNKNSISNGFEPISRQNHEGHKTDFRWKFTILVTWNYSSPPPPWKKITPWPRKIFFHEKSLGNHIPYKLSKYGVPTPSELRDISILSFVFFCIT